MTPSAFTDQAGAPKTKELAATLGRSSRLWDDLTAQLASEFRPLTEEWRFSGKKHGWALRLRHKERTILYLTPLNGHFIAGFALGERAVKAAHQSDLPSKALDVIDGARKYAEGRAVRIEVRSRKDLEVVSSIATIKMAN